jgi:hypothetical protein
MRNEVLGRPSARGLAAALVIAATSLMVALPAGARASELSRSQLAGARSLLDTPGVGDITTRDACAPPRAGHTGCLAVGLVSAPTGRPIIAHPRRISRPTRLRMGALEAPALAQSTSEANEPSASAAPSAGTPLYLQQAYDLTALSASGGTGVTVGIVDAYNDPTAASDLAYYRSYFGLPACTTANGCLRVVGQTGSSSSLPSSTDSGWQTEESLDIDAVSALCPNCHILLAEANSTSWSDMEAAEHAAVVDGATVVSNSWSGNGPAGSVSASAFSFNGVAVLAASGDYGWDGGSSNTAWPAALPSVNAVGGTTLTATSTPRGFTETAWSGTGSGCANESKPSYQTDSGCSGRSYNDISADADPNSGLVTYDSADGGWSVWGGTSLATPLTAAYFALVGGGAGQGSAAWEYGESSLLGDPSSGSNGTSCSPTYICTASSGYDGPTGAGSISGDVVSGAPGIGGPDTANGYVSSETATSATVSAGIWPNGNATTYDVEYGPTDAYGQTSAGVSVGAGPGLASAPVTLTGLTPGAQYHYRIVAANAQGTSYGYDETFTAGTPSVAITSAPPASSVNTSGVVDYTESPGVSSTACTLDTASVPCSTTSATLTGLAVGTHTFVVTVSAQGGSGQASATFTVVAPPAPAVAITAAPATVTSPASFTVSYEETGTVTATTCQLDGVAITACGSGSASVGAPSIGTHTFVVDVAGPGGSAAAVVTFSVLAAPSTASPSKPADSTPSASEGSGSSQPASKQSDLWSQVALAPQTGAACDGRAGACSPLRATLSFRLAATARVTISLFRVEEGAKHLVGTVTVVRRSGKRRVELASVFRGRALRSGSYLLSARARNIGGRSRQASKVFRARLWIA